MGVQATMTIGDKRGSAATVIASGGATYPGANQVRVVTILPTADLHRSVEIHSAIRACLDYARDNNLFVASGAMAVVTSLDGKKAAIRTVGIAANVVTGDVGIMIAGSVRNQGGINITDNAHKQLLDWMREEDRLVA